MHIRHRRLLLATAAAGVLALSGCASDDSLPYSATLPPTTATRADAAAPATEGGASTTATTSLEGLAEALRDGDFSVLGQAVAAAGMDVVDSPEFTFFAPTDDAFRSLDATGLRALLADPSELGEVLRNHVVEEKLTAADLAARTTVRTAAGNELAVVVEGDSLTVGGAKITSPDREAGDGVIHGIDAVLVPEQ